MEVFSAVPFPSLLVSYFSSLLVLLLFPNYIPLI